MTLKYTLAEKFYKTNYKYKISELPYVVSSTDPESEFYIFDGGYKFEYIEIF